MKFIILTLFPEMFPGPLGCSLPGKALKSKIWNYKTFNIRDFSHLKHHKVDDKPFGGGNGMVMRPDIVHKALEHVVQKSPKKTKIIHFSPRGRKLTQSIVKEYNKEKNLILLCGHYEGIDQRVIDFWQPDEISIGDYILSGGEMAALIFMDTVLRYTSLKNKETLENESFELALLEHSQYTRPREWNNMKVPEILLSGHHEEIKKWQKHDALALTEEKRPDLWELYIKETS